MAFNQCKTNVALMVVFFNSSSKAHAHYEIKLFNFTAGIYFLQGKLTAVLNLTSFKLTEVKFAPKRVLLRLKSCKRK